MSRNFPTTRFIRGGRTTVGKQSVSLVIQNGSKLLPLQAANTLSRSSVMASAAADAPEF
jgi:hypothetical protein